MESERSAALLTPRKVALQVIGWLAGIGLLAWVIHGAAQKGDWEKIRHADPALVAALIGCTLVSAILNGTTFWITIQPLRPVRFLDMQRVNVVANMLNYAPVRLGAVARFLYHMRVDRLTLLQIGAWFSLIGYVLFLGVGACLLATLIRSRVDWVWGLLVIGQMAVGGAMVQAFAGHPLIVRHGRGIDQMARNHRGLWSALGLRILDLSAYAGRMAAALAILDIRLPASHTVVLAMVALAASLIPFGRVGFREFCVSAVAARLTIEHQLDQSVWNQLALVESAGEALFFIPAGAILMLWFRKRLAQRQPVQT